MKRAYFYIFRAGWVAHNSMLHGDRLTQSLEMAWERFQREQKQIVKLADEETPQ